MKSSGRIRITPLATKVTLIVLLIILVNTITIGVLSFIIHRDDSIQASSEKAMAFAKSAAMSITPGEFRYALETGKKNEHYKYLERQFKKVQEDEGLAFFYAGSFDPIGTPDVEGAMGPRTGDTLKVVMNIYIEPMTKNFDLNVPVRNTMFQQTATDAFTSGEARVTEPYIFNVNGRPGIAAYAPIFDEDNKAIGLIGVLMNIDDVLARSNNFAILMLAISLLIFIVIMWVPVLYLRKSIAKPLSFLQTASNKITKGEMDIHIPIRNSNDEVGMLSKNFHTMQEIVTGMQSDIKNVVENALEGNLSYRTESDKYPGEWHEVISKFNDLMDTISHPIDEVVFALSEIANGNFDVRIESKYKGDFDRMKKSVNSTAIDLDKHLTEKQQAQSEAYKAELAKGRAEAVSEAMLSSARYANKIQQNLLPKDTVFEKAFSDYSILWHPRDIVGGDIYWMKNFDKGSFLAVSDCTGHGTPGALLTMLVASTLETLISEDNCSDPAQILYMLDQRLATVLNAKKDSHNSMEINDGCDIVVLFIAKNGQISMSAGNINVLSCNGNEVSRYKGQKLFIGEGRLTGKDAVDVVNIPQNPDNKFYIASDGLYDQIGGEHKKQFGFKTLERIILENHHEKQKTISDKIWDAFEKYRGEEQRRDDFELITFQL